METESIKRELLSLERKYWQALKDKDVEAAKELTDFPCIVAGPQGVNRIDRRSFEKLMTEADYELCDFKIKDAEVRFLSDDVAVVAYNVHESLVVEGRPISLDGAEVSVWILKNGKWACAMHSEALIGDPYGRDKVTAKKAA